MSMLFHSLVLQYVLAGSSLGREFVLQQLQYFFAKTIHGWQILMPSNGIVSHFCHRQENLQIFSFTNYYDGADENSFPVLPKFEFE